jgi:class 3 adenylate cyclase
MNGICTFLFTDIEGSTRRWEADPTEMRARSGSPQSTIA